MEKKIFMTVSSGYTHRLIHPQRLSEKLLFAGDPTNAEATAGQDRVGDQNAPF